MSVFCLSEFTCIHQDMEYCSRSGAVLLSCRGGDHEFCCESEYRLIPHCSNVKTAPTPTIYDFPGPFSFDGLFETQKENLSQSRACRLLFNTPKKDRSKSSVTGLEKDAKTEHVMPSSPCQTPKVSKKDAVLQRRLHVSTTAADGKTGNAKALFCRPVASSGRVESEFSGGSFHSPDGRQFEALAASVLKADELAQLCRKRHLEFSKFKTSTLEDGKNGAVEPPFCALSWQVTEPGQSTAETDFSESAGSPPSGPLGSELFESPCLAKFTASAKGDFQTPVKALATSLTISSTPSFTPLSDTDASAGEDSGFSTLALDKSQGSSADQDGSFQELLFQQASGGKDAPSRAESKRRYKLDQRCRLSVLSEGASQSGEELVTADATSRHPKPQPKAEAHHIIAEGGELLQERTPPRTTTAAPGDLSLTPALQMVHNICQRGARMLPGQTSLEELMRSSEGAQPFKTSMPLTGLIGRKMGLRKLDILSELKERNLRHVLATILNLLSPEDIFRFGQVSNFWDEIIAQDKMTSRRRRLYWKEQKMALEGSADCVPDAETRLNLLSRCALRPVQAQSKTPSFCPPLSGTDRFTPVKHIVKNTASKQEEFLQVARTLFSDECLRACPRCQHPARCHSVKREGVCTRGDCEFQFCTCCLCVYHGSKECGSWSATRHNKREVLAGSAQSKRNLRRL